MGCPLTLPGIPPSPGGGVTVVDKHLEETLNEIQPVCCGDNMFPPQAKMYHCSSNIGYKVDLEKKGLKLTNSNSPQHSGAFVFQITGG